MPNRTVTVRLGVDGSAAVAGLKKVADAAKGTAAGIKGQLGSTTPAVDKVGKSAGGLGGTFKKVGLAGAAGFAAIGAGAIGLGVGLGKAVNKAAGFESTMRQVGVQTGQSGEALKNMTDLALQMGKETSFSAQGASDAMLELAKGGLSAADQRAGALKETLTLASAGGLELGDAAGYMTQGLNTFGLEAGDAGRVAAALAGAANASTASVQDMGIALGQVGPSAAQLGLSIEDTTAALAAFTNNGMKGSDAGTSLKTMLTRLQPTTLETQRLFDELGLTTAEAGNRFFDAEGNIKSMTEVAGVLSEALKGQTREQKAATLSTIFGSDAQRAGAILAKEGAAGIAEYAKQTSDSAAANELAKSATEGFSGAMERFQGALETAQIQLGLKFLPILSKALDYLSGPGMDALSGAATILQDTFAPQLNSATGGLSKFFDYLSTHQSVVIEAFKSFGNGVFDFGVAIAKMAAGGLRSFGAFTVGATKGILNFIGVSIDGLLSLAEPINRILDVAKVLNPAFAAIKPIDLSESKRQFDTMRDSAIRGAEGAQTSLNGLADDIDRDVIPSVEKMRDRFNKSANTQIFKAEQRDAVAAMGLAFEATGKLIGSGAGQVNSYKDAARELGKTSSKLNDALGTAKTRFEDAYEAAKNGGAKQAELNEITKGYKEQLLDTLTQMTGNREEAEKLAEKYNLMPSKVVTDAEFKAKAAEASAKEYREYVNEQQKKHNILSEAEWDAKKAKTDSRTYREYVNDEQAKHKVLSKAEWDARAARGSAEAYRKYVNGEQAKHKVLSKAEWDARKAKTDNRTYREYVNDQQSRHKVLSKAEWDARNAKANAKAYREYVNEQQNKVNKQVTVKVNWDTEVDKMNTKLTMKYGKGARLISVGGPSAGSSLDRSVGPAGGVSGPPLTIGASGMPVKAPVENDRKSKSGGPTLNQVYTAGTKAVTEHGTGQVAKLLKQLSPQVAVDSGSSGSPGGKVPTRNVGGGWGPVQNAMRKHGARAFNTYPGHHPSMAMARDVYPHNWAAANAARALSSVWYVIYRMKIASKNHGNGWRPYKPTNFNGDWQHVNHIHVARRYDTGGILKHGGVGYNTSKRPERILSPTQTASFEKLVTTLDRQGGSKPQHVVTDARWQQLINTRSQPARIDSADMARLVEAIRRIDGGQIIVNNPVAEPASRTIATRSLYSTR